MIKSVSKDLIAIEKQSKKGDVLSKKIFQKLNKDFTQNQLKILNNVV